MVRLEVAVTVVYLVNLVLCQPRYLELIYSHGPRVEGTEVSETEWYIVYCMYCRTVHTHCIYVRHMVPPMNAW